MPLIFGADGTDDGKELRFMMPLDVFRRTDAPVINQLQPWKYLLRQRSFPKGFGLP
jgi:hypothetical protein